MENINSLTTEEWDSIEKDFLINLNQNFFEEANKDIQTLRKNDPSSIKTQMCIAFVLADSLSRIYKAFQGVRGDDLDIKNEERFREWIDSFVLDDKNEVYKKHKSHIAPNSKFVWNLRNSFLHFYCFPSSEKMGGFVIIGFNLEDKLNEKVLGGLKKENYTIHYVDGYRFIEAIFHGFLLQLESMKKMIEEDPQNYIKHVLYLQGVLQNQTTRAIPFNKR